MNYLKSFIKSGIVESYVLGNSTTEEAAHVEQMARRFNEVQAEIESISATFELYAFSNAMTPRSTVKAQVMATIDYTERLKNGETPSFPPGLVDGSTVRDFSAWLNRADMILPPWFSDLYVKIIGYTPASTTAIVWIKESTPPEIHTNEYEKFLILEGTCNITVEEEIYSLQPGDFFAIPLHKNHQVIVTSLIPCKVILQRTAA